MKRYNRTREFCVSLIFSDLSSHTRHRRRRDGEKKKWNQNNIRRASKAARAGESESKLRMTDDLSFYYQHSDIVFVLSSLLMLMCHAGELQNLCFVFFFLAARFSLSFFHHHTSSCVSSPSRNTFSLLLHTEKWLWLALRWCCLCVQVQCQMSVNECSAARNVD